jgi:hypothetical protein
MLIEAEFTRDLDGESWDEAKRTYTRDDPHGLWVSVVTVNGEMVAWVKAVMDDFGFLKAVAVQTVFRP